MGRRLTLCHRRLPARKRVVWNMLMKKLTMQDINAYLDGALSDEERRDVEAVLARDPAAQSMLNRYRRQVDELKRLYDPVMEEPVPESMLALLRGGAQNVGQS